MVPLPLHARLPLRQLPDRQVRGQVGGPHRVQRLHGRNGLHPRQAAGAGLEETGQLENTIIILTSDNGPEHEIPPHGRSPCRGGKGSCWEGGVRVPTFVYWKGMIEPRRSDGLFDQVDILPTAFSLAGMPGAKLAEFFPKTTYTDGIDQTSFLVSRRRRVGSAQPPLHAQPVLRYDARGRVQCTFTAEIENGFFKKGDWGGFSGPIVTDSGGGNCSTCTPIRRRT